MIASLSSEKFFHIEELNCTSSERTAGDSGIKSYEVQQLEKFIILATRLRTLYHHLTHLKVCRQESVLLDSYSFLFSVKTNIN